MKAYSLYSKDAYSSVEDPWTQNILPFVLWYLTHSFLSHKNVL